jgi:hypothetical protein
MALLLDLARQAGYVDPEPALQLLEQIIALAHGYAALDTDGFVTGARLPDVDVATRATDGAAALLRAGASPRPRRNPLAGPGEELR